MDKKPKIFDVLIVGAGPSGLHAARLLAEKGLEVLIVEAKDEIGKNVICTGIIGKESFERFGFSNEQVVRSIQSVKLDSPFGTSIHYKHPYPFAFVLDRQKFDKYLLELALNQGVEIVLQCRVTDVAVDEAGVEIDGLYAGYGSVKYRGKVLILATGIDYELNKKLNLGYPVHFIKAAQKYMRFDKSDDVTLIIGNEFAKNGFGWIVPVDNGMARVGLISVINPKGGFEKIIERYFPDEKNLSLQIKPIAQGIVSKTYSGRVLVIGEAAGQVKTTTGGGVYFGLLCAEIAADVVKDAFDALDFSGNKFGIYEKRWKMQIGKEIRLGTVARNFCGRMNDRQMERIFSAVQADGFFDYIAKHADFDWHGNFVLSFIKRLSKFISVL